MCVVSMIGDHYNDKWKDFDFDKITPYTTQPDLPDYTTGPYIEPTVSKKDFDALKKEVQEMKQLLIKAKSYDERNNEPNCEMEEKVALLKRVAEMVGVDLDEIFKK